MQKMAIEQAESKNFLESITDDFRYYIDVDRSKQMFIIRDMITEEEIQRVPKYLMSYINSP